MYISNKHNDIANKLNIEVFTGIGIIYFKKKSNLIIISKDHHYYAGEILRGFDYYFESVNSFKLDGMECVDFSHPAFHDLKDFTEHPVYFHSFPEPVSTTLKYLELVKNYLDGDIYDLGAYCGISSIIFSKESSITSKIIAIEADINNYKALTRNLQLSDYKKITPMNVCISNFNGEAEFSTEGNVGAGLINLHGLNRGVKTKVKSMKLSTLANCLHSQNISLIKCDIEGSESIIFDDDEFFKKYHPVILIENHYVNSISTLDKVKSDLIKYNYNFEIFSQPGNGLPMILCK